MAEEQNKQVVQGFFDSFVSGTFREYIDNNFTDDIQYVVITDTTGGPEDVRDDTFVHERDLVVPFTGLHVGKPAVQDFLTFLTSEYALNEFRVDKIIAEGDNVAAFGAFFYQNQRTGNRAVDLPFAINIEMRDGKIAKYNFYEDAYSFAAASRQGGTWGRTIGGVLIDVTFGTTGADTLDGAEGNSPGDIIFGYQMNDVINGDVGDDTLWGGNGDDSIMGGDGSDSSYGGEGADTVMGGTGDDWMNGNQMRDMLDGGEGNDTLYGGKENDTVTGGNGDDRLWGDLGDDMLSGGVGVDTFVFGSDTGTDIVMDYADGEDKIALTGGLTFAQLSLTQGTDGTEIRVGEQLLVTLMNVQLTALGADDFSPIA